MRKGNCHFMAFKKAKIWIPVLQLQVYLISLFPNFDCKFLLFVFFQFTEIADKAITGIIGKN